jgi:hypothetical protein
LSEILPTSALGGWQRCYQNIIFFLISVPLNTTAEKYGKKHAVFATQNVYT